MSSPQGRAHHFSRSVQPERLKFGNRAPEVARQPTLLRSISSNRNGSSPKASSSVAVAEPPQATATLNRSEIDMIPFLREDLPIAKSKYDILRALESNNIIIITAETGAGKSTQVPQYLLDAGYTVTMTQPRRLAASAIANRIAYERNGRLGDEVGFRHAFTGLASEKTRLTVTTDGYQLRQALYHSQNQTDVIIIDEFHERNQSMDAMLALHEKRLDQYRHGLGSKPPKLIIMSATIDTDRLSSRLGAPVISCERRRFHIEEKMAGSSIAADVLELADQGKNTLIFLPGKGEIRAMQEQLEELGINAEIVPLHSQLTAEEQELAFKSYDRPKIVLATNIAETSITIPDIDAVIDSGLERRVELIDGVETLAIGPISRFNVLQRMGRCGRTGPGIYIYHGVISIDDLDLCPSPEIERVPLERLALTLIAGRESIKRLDFIDPPPVEHVERAYSALYHLNLIGPRSHLTSEGANVAQLPVEVRTGKMLVKAAELARWHPKVLENAIDLAAIVEAEGVTIPEQKTRWSRFCRGESSSDHIAQLRVFHGAQELDGASLESKGIDPTSFRRALEIRRLLDRRMNIESRSFPREEPPIFGEMREALLESVWTGNMDSIFRFVGHRDRDSSWKGLHGRGERKLSRGSVVEGAALIVGRPYDLVVLRKHFETKTIPLVLMASAIDPVWLEKHVSAPLKHIIAPQVRRAKRAAVGGHDPYKQHNGRRRHRRH